MENSHQALWDKCLHLIEGRAYASGAGSKYVRVRVLGAVLRGTIK